MVVEKTQDTQIMGIVKMETLPRKRKRSAVQRLDTNKLGTPQIPRNIISNNIYLPGEAFSTTMSHGVKQRRQIRRPYYESSKVVHEGETIKTQPNTAPFSPVDMPLYHRDEA